MPNQPSDILPTVIGIINGMIDDLELDVDGPVDADTALIADLGFASVDFIHLIVEIETSFGQKMGFHDLIMPDGKYVDDLKVGTVVEFVAKRLSGAADPAEELQESYSPKPDCVQSPLTQPEIETFLAQVRSVQQKSFVPAPHPKKRAVFVFSSPRSGSTLLRILLAGNPALFAPPELHLLGFSTMAQRLAALNNSSNDHLLSGTVRALMQLRSCTVEEAEAFSTACEACEMPVAEFYGELQKLLGDRLLVDKTPTYAYNADVLHRAETDFDSPLFIHLVRHPCGTIQSFQDAKFEQLFPFLRDSGMSSRHLAELTWLICNKNIAEFAETIAPERVLRVQYENLVRHPEPTLRGICEFLKVPFDVGMLNPYTDQGQRMTDGLNSAGEYSGDLKFHLHSRIEPDAADRWRKFTSDASLSEEARSLAARLGY